MQRQIKANKQNTQKKKYIHPTPLIETLYFYWLISTPKDHFSQLKNVRNAKEYKNGIVE
jgi:hypothetical protein